MNAVRRKYRSIADTIVTLGDEAMCILLVSPTTLAAMPRPGVVRLLSAQDIMSHGGTAVEVFLGALRGMGVNHPNLALAAALYACLTALRSRPGAPTFEGVGKTPEQIDSFFRNQQPAQQTPSP
jgi:hypothetical protein